MARAMGNLLGLAVLGVLVQRPMHRYEIARTIREQGKDDDLAVALGSLYTAVGTLQRLDWVEATGTERAGARPERTTYRITDAGRHELVDWTRDLLEHAPAAHPDFVAGLSMLGALPPDAAAALLRTRVERLDADLGRRRDALAEAAQRVPRLFLLEDEYGIAMREAERTWLRALLDELDRGRFPDLDEWRRVQASLLTGRPEGDRSD